MPRHTAPLTDTACRTAKPSKKARKLFDGRGLYLEVAPGGGRWWRLKYRHGGKEKRLSLGTYPDTSLAMAREKRDDARKLLASGIDPSAHRKATVAALASQDANSVEVVAREWFGKQKSSWVPEHASRVLMRLENDVFPYLGKQDVGEITAKELLACLNRVADRGAIESAHRILQCVGQVFRYAIATDRAERNPASDLRGALPPVKPEHHAAITDPKAIGKLLRAINAYEGHGITRAALRLAALTFVRPGELRQAEWSEFDLDAAEWNIPAERMKMREPHLVPLSDQAVEILRELYDVTGRGGSGRFVFPNPRSRERPMSSGGVLAALRRMGYDKATMSGHGFRAMARTVLDEQLHFRADYIEHQLAHAVRDPNGRAYNRTAHLPERREMMQSWADYLDALRAGGKKVVPMKRKRA
jgi:integrase